MKQLTEQYKNELLNNVVPFWTQNCQDKKYGGYFTMLDRDGSVYDTNKYMWMQWRIVWMYCELYQQIEQKQEWLDIAQQGYNFLTKYGKDSQNRYYFALAQNGTPTVAPYNVFSECFAVMGAAALYRVTGDEQAKNEAINAYNQYQIRKNNPKAEWNKILPGSTDYLNLGYYMMQANLDQVMADCLNENSYLERAATNAELVLTKFWNQQEKVIFENVLPDGSFDCESVTGRHLNPGHALEAMWFLMNTAKQRNDEHTISKTADIMLHTLDLGWDKKYGGIYYFMDVHDKPQIALEANMKLWWVHCEALIACLMAEKYTGNDKFNEWFHRIHDWTWQNFPDPENGEWFGYLDRTGNPTHYLKGGKWKTFFHLPRALLICSQLLNS
jgi:N-acylglucosamine 2-epimerase